MISDIIIRNHFFAVEYRYADGSTTFDIFPTLQQADAYVLTFTNPNNCLPELIWEADFDMDMVYQEKDGSWNYDEYSGLVANKHEIRKITTKFPKHYIIY